MIDWDCQKNFDNPFTKPPCFSIIFMRILAYMHKKEIFMSQIVREGFAQFCKRQKAGLLLVGEIQKQEKKDQEALLDVQEKRFERKYNLFYENLDLIMRHKDAIGIFFVK